jgi:hypothetical protein
MRDPHLGAFQAPAALDFARARNHPAGIGAEVGLGEPEATNQLAGGQAGQVLLTLRLGPVRVDGIHHQARLHAHAGAIAGIHAFDLARDQAITHVVHPRAAVSLESRAEKAQSPHLAQDLRLEALVAIGLDHARHEFVLRISARRIAHHALLFSELFFEQQRIFPVEHRFLERRVHTFLLAFQARKYTRAACEPGFCQRIEWPPRTSDGAGSVRFIFATHVITIAPP